MMYSIFAKMVDSEKGLISWLICLQNRTESLLCVLLKTTKTIQEFQLGRWMTIAKAYRFVQTNKD